MNEAFKINYTLMEQMALKGRFGFSRFMQKYHHYFFTFYQFDMPLGILLVVTKVYPGYVYEKIAAVNIFIKSLMMMVMTAESLMSHQLGPKPAKKTTFKY